jgi:hypothetical protein
MYFKLKILIISDIILVILLKLITKAFITLFKICVFF